MKSSVRFSLAALVVVALACTVFVSTGPTAKSSARTNGAAAVDPNAKKQSPEAKALNPTTAEEQKPAQVAKIAVSTSIAQVLPGLSQPVNNWREFKPAKIVIAPYPDTPMEFEMISVREENGRTIWNGRNALTGAFLVTVATEKEIHAVLDIPMADSFAVLTAWTVLACHQTVVSSIMS